MSARRPSRREFLQTSTTAALAAASLPYWSTSTMPLAQAFQSPNERPVLGCIGTGDRWQGVGPQALNFSDCVAVCDVDKAHVEQGRAKVKEIQDKKGQANDVEMHEDYRKILDRKDIDVVTIVTPDHWHSKIAIEAMQAGKDVYCEKPLTLTIEEGKQIIKVLNETKRVFQVGTQQRSEFNMKQPVEMTSIFLKAVALCHLGRLGQIKRVQCAIGGAPESKEIPKADVPAGLNWDMWLGQAPMTDYLQGGFGNNGRYPEARTHYEFRWWYEYSGGKMTDWGAHHIDIAQWAMGLDKTGPISIEGTAKHPVPFENGVPTVTNRYNAATEFLVTAMFANGMELVIRHDTDNGILIEGTEGRIFVSRGKLTGAPVEALKDNPIPEEFITKLYKGKTPGNHMGNFFECVKDRGEPISDVWSHHRAMSTAHLANIAIRLGRKIQWNPETEQIENDKDAAQWQGREQRKGYEIKA